MTQRKEYETREIINYLVRAFYSAGIEEIDIPRLGNDLIGKILRSNSKEIFFKK